MTEAEAPDGLRWTPIDTVLRIESPLWLVSQWSAEFETDRRLFSGRLQLMAPGGEQVLSQRMEQFDFRHTVVFRYIHRIPDMRYVGLGTYEFHVFVAAVAEQGEWGRACLRVY